MTPAGIGAPGFRTSGQLHTPTKKPPGWFGIRRAVAASTNLFINRVPMTPIFLIIPRIVFIFSFLVSRDENLEVGGLFKSSCPITIQVRSDVS